MPPDATYLAAATAFVAQVGALPDDLAGPGLGDWDLRALVGHTSRSLVTVRDYLAAPEPEAVALDSAAAYVAALAEAANGAPGVLERGRAAGEALGSDPAGAVTRLLEEATAALAPASPARILTTFGGGMRLGDYLPTRTFELVVHGFDIASATGASYEPPAAALAEVTALCAEVAVLRGDGGRFLRVVTGRDPGPFTIV